MSHDVWSARPETAKPTGPAFPVDHFSLIIDNRQRRIVQFIAMEDSVHQTIKASEQNLNAVFSDTYLFEIPLYQRPICLDYRRGR